MFWALAGVCGRTCPPNPKAFNSNEANQRALTGSPVIKRCKHTHTNLRRKWFLSFLHKFNSIQNYNENR